VFAALRRKFDTRHFPKQAAVVPLLYLRATGCVAYHSHRAPRRASIPRRQKPEIALVYLKARWNHSASPTPVPADSFPFAARQRSEKEPVFLSRIRNSTLWHRPTDAAGLSLARRERRRPQRQSNMRPQVPIETSHAGFARRRQRHPVPG